MKYFTIIILLFVSACQSLQHPLQKKSLDEVYIPSGAEQFFLPSLPTWASVSLSAGCRRDDTPTFFDFDRLSRSYDLKYEDLIQLQLLYNQNLKKQTKLKETQDLLRPRDEEVLFFNVLDKIQGGIKAFIVPEFSTINLIWIDQAMINPNIVKRLKTLLASEKLDNGQPVFVSICYGQEKIENFLKDLNWQGKVSIISAPMFTSFNTSNELALFFSLDLTKVFRKDQQLIFYNTQDLVPMEIKGPILTKKY